MSIVWNESPVSMTELGIYLDWVKAPEKTAYNISYLFPLPAGTDADLLKVALIKVLNSHRGLLSRFARDKSGNVVRRTPEGDCNELIKVEFKQGEPDLKELIRPFSDTEGGLSRFEIIKGKAEYSLFIDIHHLIFDGTSTRIFIDELNRAYKGEECAGEKINPGDVAFKEQDKRKSPVFKEAEEWYQGLLGDFENNSTLIHDREGGEGKCAYIEHTIDMDALAISGFVKELGIRMSTFFSGVYGYVLSRFSGTEDVLYASVHSGRDDENEKTVGMFVKTFPVRENFSGDMSLKAHLKELNEQTGKSRSLNIFSYADINAGFAPNIPTLFAYQGDMFKETEFLSASIIPEAIPSSDPKQEMVTEVIRDKGRYILRIEYRRDLFEHLSMGEFACAYEKAVEEFLIKEKYSDIDILSQEKLRVIDSFISYADPEGEQGDIVSMFRQAAAAHPDSNALILGDIKRTYKEVDDMSDRIAAYLKNKDIGRGCVAGIMIHRNEFMITASLGVLKSGAAYLPLDPTYPSERLNLMINDAGVSLIIADRDLADIPEGFEERMLFTDDIPKLPPVPEGSVLPVPSKEDLFTLLYTSGSTGTPKGVMLKHGNLANFCTHYANRFSMGVSTVCAAYASYGFDANMMDMYPALTSGACVCIVPNELRMDLKALGAYLGENNVSLVFMTTQVGRQFAQSGFAPSCLKTLLAGGERLAGITPCGDLKFVNVYGPTECTVFVTLKEVDKEYHRIPIGRAFAGAALYVVGKNGKRVPPCVPGELWVAGPCVAGGYLNRPDKNAESFTENPFSDAPGYERVYHTGDIVRFLPDGEVDYIGRNDGQVKIRGFRIELTEVESVIREHPDVVDVTVQAFDNRNGSGKYLAAYIVQKEGCSVDRQEMIDFIRKAKPPYMVPSVIVKIDRIPLTGNQKVDKRALPEPVNTGIDGVSNEKRELTLLEKELTGIILKVTGNDDPGVSTPLTDAGLTSISAMQLISMLTDEYGFSPDAGELLNGMSILGLENVLIGHLKTAAVTGAGETGDGREQAEILRAPLTKTQLGIYLECMMDERSDKYNIPLLYKLGGNVDVKRLKEAVIKTVEAHPFMKCSVEATDDGGADMIMHPGLEWDVVTEDTKMSDEEIQERLKNEPVLFKLSRAPLFDLRIIRTDTSIYLFMVFHHIIMDGTSVSIFIEDIETAYRGGGLTPESYDSMALALDEKKDRDSEAFERARTVYDRIFKDVSVNSLPRTEVDKTVLNENNADTAFYNLDDVDENEVLKFCKENRVTETSLFTAVFAFMLYKLSGNEEVMFSAVHNGRMSAKTMRIMGMLVKTYPFYITVDKNGNPADLVRKVSSRIRELTSNMLYSFSEAVRDYNVNADIMFAYQGDSFGDYTIAGDKAVQITMPLKDAKAPLSMDVSKSEGRYNIAFEFRTDMYLKEQIVWMSDLFAAVVKGFISVNDLKGIDILSTHAKEFLGEINNTEFDVPFIPVRYLFEKNAEEYPDRTAVIAGDTAVTYKELNEAANRIAHGLISSGVRNRITALMLPRSEKVYMVRQGILKAGSAFLSIDPEYPDERVKMMIEDSEAALLIVNSELKSARCELLDTLDCNVVTVEELLKNEDKGNPDISVLKDDLAYCIFTSGSTGRPKGVMLTQGNLLNFLNENVKNHEILGYTRYAHNSLALAAITFDVSVMEEFIPLTHGMTVCMANEEQIHDPSALAQFMIKNNVDMVTATPSFMLSCIELDVMKEALKNVKSYDFGAEAFPASLFDKITAINPEAYIMNGYGPTEATISCTMERITGTGLITIGRPSSNVKAYIIDEDGKIMPPLVPGELVIAGEGVGKGYIKRPELTKEKFIELFGMRAYRTGDIASWTSDGRLRFQGRADDQVKLRGLRIELSEIENAINSVDGVNTSVVIMSGDEGSGFLAGFYTAVRDLAPDEIKGEISRTLTPYMIPGVLMQLDELPLTANGKVDKKRLPKVSFKADAGKFREPANEAERDFCSWFSEVLKIDKISADANFFEIGGTSLTASIIAMRAKDKGYRIVYADIFKAQTPTELAILATGSASDKKDSKEKDEISDYDYRKLNMSNNTDNMLTQIVRGDIGNIMITGAMGFLGIHVLREYLLNYDGTAYCMVRGKNCERRLKSLYFYYFSEMPDEYFGSGRLKIIVGDITDEETLKTAEDLPFDTLINCAAIVKHFVKDDSLLKTNYGGVKNLIKLCQRKGVRLIQTSTVSIAGEGLDGTPAPDRLLHENELYFGQRLDNAYIYSKFLAERAVLEAIPEGLDGKIVRLGNLMGRSVDGEFQINFRTNAFIRSLASYKAIGAVPFSLLNVTTDFSEIDMTAAAILRLAGTDRQFNIFHPINNHNVTYADIVYSMREYGMKVDMVEDEEFDVRAAEAGEAAGALFAYNSREGMERRYVLGADCTFTTKALYRLDFKWPVTDESYIIKMLEALRGMYRM